METPQELKERIEETFQHVGEGRVRFISTRQEVKQNMDTSILTVLAWLKERVEQDLKKKSGAKFYGIDEKYWVKARIIPPDARKEIRNKGLDDVRSLIESLEEVYKQTQ
jgi:hypothetical protein